MEGMGLGVLILFCIVLFGIIGSILLLISVFVIRSHKVTGTILLVTGLIFALPGITTIISILDDNIKEANNSRLVQAIKAKQYDELELLIKKGYDINEVRYSYNPPALICAIEKRDSISVKILVENGVDVNQKTTKGWPLEVAIEERDTAIISCLLKHGAVTKDMSPIQYAVDDWNCRKEVVEVLLKHGADANDTSGFHTPLQIAVIRNNYEVVKLLLEYGANPNLTRSKEGIDKWIQKQ